MNYIYFALKRWQSLPLAYLVIKSRPKITDITIEMKVILLITIFLYSVCFSVSANEKVYCKFITKEFIAENLRHFSYKEFKDFLYSRKVPGETNKSILSYIFEDKFKYKNIKETIKYIKRMNGFKKYGPTTGEYFSMPLCLQVAKRKIASILQEKKLKPIKSFQKNTLFNFQLHTGKYGLIASSKELNMNFLRMSTGLKYQFTPTYTFKSDISLIQYLNIKFNQSDQITNSDFLYPEWNASLARNFERYHLGISYNFFNYFTFASSNTSQVIEPDYQNSFSLFFQYDISDNFSINLTSGVSSNLKTQEVKGSIYTLGVSQSINLKHRVHLNYKKMEFIDFQDQSSNAQILNLKYTFSY